ncbi:MAG: hypothetical protein DBO99_08955 [gamma proteobacterium symbiont of Ctena orbiculata]|nr:MAG: hypothetical protein DBO99_08955 [gamma proteobacterium symbiont of Ctena orbiculata]
MLQNTLFSLPAWTCVLFTLLATEFLVQPAAAQTLNVRTEIDGFFKDYLGRSLTERELEATVLDYQAHFGNPDHCNSACEKALQSHIASRSVLIQSPDTPKELLLRHIYLKNAVFNPRNQGGIILKLLAEPDPVAFVDYKEQRLMTKRDLEALVALLYMSKSGKLGLPTRLDARQFAEAKAFLATQYAGNTGRRLPILFVIAVELYTGIARDWERLSKADRTATLVYLEEGGMKRAQNTLPARLFQQFLDIDVKAAQDIADKQALEAFATMSQRIDRLSELMGRAEVIHYLGEISRM